MELVARKPIAGLVTSTYTEAAAWKDTLGVIQKHAMLGRYSRSRLGDYKVARLVG